MKVMNENRDEIKHFKYEHQSNSTEPEFIETSDMNGANTEIKIEQGLDPLSTVEHEHENDDVKVEAVDLDLV